MPEELATTTSLCPACLTAVPGTYEARDGAVYLDRTCPDHGTATRQVWGSRDHWEWAGQFGPDPEGDGGETAPEPDDSGPVDSTDVTDLSADFDPDAGQDCCAGGDCCGGVGSGGGADAPAESTADATGDPAADATDPATGVTAGDADGDDETGDAATDLRVPGDHACLAVVEITQDCNLSCSYCFASSGPGGMELPFEAVVDRLETVREEAGTRPIQFSGGEPTVHDRLPELVEHARGMGFDHVEVNTNGIVLATADGYAERLAEAGVTAVYLQFDGLSSETYERIREVDLLDVKREAIAACRRAGLSVILVPTVVPGVNDDELGDVVRFAMDNTDVVEAVNVQPVAHFGRYAKNEGRFSLDAAARRLADQVDALEARDFLPVPCCSSYCQLSTAVLPADDGPVPLTGLVDLENYDDLAALIDEADWMELLAGTAAGEQTAELAGTCCGFDVGGGDVVPITLTGFMDADAADAERLDDCCISVPTPDGDLVPFCAYNMTTAEGRYAIRNRHDWGGRDHVSPDDPVEGVGAEDAAGTADPAGETTDPAGGTADSAGGEASPGER